MRVALTFEDGRITVVEVASLATPQKEHEASLDAPRTQRAPAEHVAQIVYGRGASAPGPRAAGRARRLGP